MVEAGNQAACLVPSGNGQRPKLAALLLHFNEGVRRLTHRRELPPYDPRNQNAAQQRHHHKGQQHRGLHVPDGGKGLVRGDRQGQHPAGRADLLGRNERFHPPRIDHRHGAFKARDHPINPRMGAQWRQDFKTALAFRCRHDLPMPDVHQDIAAITAVADGGYLFQKIGPPEIGHARHGAHQQALRITDRPPHPEDRGIQRLAENRFSNAHFVFFERLGHHLDIHVIQATPTRNRRKVRNGIPQEVINHDATVKQAVQ